jgi:hypothetical protein
VTDPKARPSVLVWTIFNQGTAARLLAEHKPDGRGRCPLCKSIGCSIYGAAKAAEKLGGSTGD